MIYECWYSEEDNCLTLLPEDHKQKDFLTGGDAKHLYCIKADGWTEAKKAHNEIQGWSPYRPMDGWIHIGDVLVHRGEPPNGNPYGTSLCGPERVKALKAFKEGRPLEGYTYWYGPHSGGACKIIPDEVNWETSGV